MGGWGGSLGGGAGYLGPLGGSLGGSGGVGGAFVGVAQLQLNKFTFTQFFQEFQGLQCLCVYQGGTGL